MSIYAGITPAKVFAALMMWLFMGTLASGDNSDTLDRIFRKGVVVVGVKEDYPPFGFRDEKGELSGIEIDMARDLAGALKVRLSLIPVTAATRIEMLIAGQVDLFIATMSDTQDRRQIIGAIEPNYYETGYNLIAKNDKIKGWRNLAGKAVCGNAGAYYNAEVARRFDARIVEFPDLESAKEAVRRGDCIALVYDDANLRWLAIDPLWKDFELPVEARDPIPWAIGVRSDDLNAPLGQYLSGFVCSLHAEGRILVMEKKRGLSPSRFLLSMAKRYRQTGCKSVSR